MFEKIKKRDGRVVEFDSPKITAAIAKAGKATGLLTGWPNDTTARGASVGSSARERSSSGPVSIVPQPRPAAH